MTYDRSFTNGTIELSGTLTTPEGSGPHPLVVVLHPASEGERSSWFYRHLTEALPRAGMAVFVYDRRGSGTSGGVFERAGYDDLADDGAAAVEAVAAEPAIDGARVALYGISQGGWLAPMVAQRLQAKPGGTARVAGVVAVSSSGVAPAEQMTYGVARHLTGAGFDASAIADALRLRARVNDFYRGRATREEVAALLRSAESETWFDLGYLPAAAELPMEPRATNWGRVLDHDPVLAWRSVVAPTLFLYAEVDDWVPVEESITTFRAATTHLADVGFERVPGTDHLMLKRTEPGTAPEVTVADAYLEVLVAWLERRLVATPG